MKAVPGSSVRKLVFLMCLATLSASRASAQDACNCLGPCGSGTETQITNLKQPDIIVTTDKDNEALRREILNGLFPGKKIVSGNLKYVVGMIQAQRDSLNRKVHVLVDGHGAPGRQQIGHEVIGNADTTELRLKNTFVNALAGDLENLELLGCSTGDEQAGQDFLAKMSADLGNIPIKSFTGTVSLRKNGTTYTIWVIDGAKKDVTVLANDLFNYPNGNLVQPFGANGGWYANSGAGTGPVQVSGNAIIVKEAPTFNEDVSKPLSSMQGAAAKTYASFTFLVKAGSVLVAGPTGPGTPQYFAHFRTGTSDSASAFRSRLYIVTPAGGSGYRIGITATSFNATTQPVVPFPTDLAFDVTYRAVAAYDAATGTATLWVDPASELSTNVSSVSATAVGQQVAYYAFRQGTPSDGTNVTIVVDDYIAETKFPPVRPPVVPGLTPVGMTLLSILLAGASWIVLARRRAALS